MDARLKDKYVASLLSIFGGSIGLQKLYLNQDFLFLINVIFCWTTIPLLFGVYEGVRLWKMDNKLFNNKFNRLRVNIYKEK